MSLTTHLRRSPPLEPIYTMVGPLDSEEQESTTDGGSAYAQSEHTYKFNVKVMTIHQNQPKGDD